MSELKKIVIETIDNRAQDLNALSQFLWNNPEVGYEEFQAHSYLTDFLEKEGFSVQRKTPLETSFIAKFGKSDELKVGICCEYDALPGIGHACGHNLIAEAGIAAALALKAVAESNDGLQVVVFGTPAEEGGGGKVKMIEKFAKVDFCMMTHPAPYELPSPICLAREQITMTFHGKPSHAAAAPWEGINALDAAVTCYNSISCLRQQIKPTARVHGIFTDGGKKPNIIPERAELEYYIRDVTNEDCRDLLEKVKNCAKGAATATGCTVECINKDPFYAAVKTNSTLIDLYIKNARSLGVEFNDEQHIQKLLASTDMGNVSQVKPSIHPFYKIATSGCNHTHKFTEGTGAQENQAPTLNSAKSLALSVVDVLNDHTLLDKIKQEFSAK